VNRRTIRDIQYGPERFELLDFHAVGDLNGPYPLIVFAHPGGWHTGNKEMVEDDPLFPHLLKREVHIASINYSLAPLRYPLAERDAMRAVQFLRCHAQRLHIREDMLIGWGISAGGVNLGLTAFGPDAARPNSPDPVERCSSALQGISLVSTPTDFTLLGYHPQVAFHLGANNENQWNDLPPTYKLGASIVHHATTSKTPIPPVFLDYPPGMPDPNLNDPHNRVFGLNLLQAIQGGGKASMATSFEREERAEQAIAWIDELIGS